MTKQELLEKFVEMKNSLEETRRIKGRDPIITKIKKQIEFIEKYKCDDSLCDLLYKEIKPIFDDFIKKADWNNFENDLL